MYGQDKKVNLGGGNLLTKAVGDSQYHSLSANLLLTVLLVAAPAEANQISWGLPRQMPRVTGNEHSTMGGVGA